MSLACQNASVSVVGLNGEEVYFSDNGFICSREPKWISEEKGATAYMMQIYSLQSPVQEQILPVIAWILDQFQDVFSEPQGVTS
jgi:hypothetical protein